MPVLIMLVLIPVQVGLWWHAKQAAETAADEALDAAQVESATVADGQAGATAILGQAGNLENVVIDVDRSGTTVSVTVSGQLGFSIPPVRGASPLTPKAVDLELAERWDQRLRLCMVGDSGTSYCGARWVVRSRRRIGQGRGQ